MTGQSGSLGQPLKLKRGWRIKCGHAAEVYKSSRYLPLRRPFARVPNRLARLKPCLMMSPLAVSTYLESPEFQFDVVIFDKASQVLSWDAIGAVYPGRQLVVGGDQKQWPPSTFFDRMVNNDDDSEDADDLGDFGYGATRVAALNNPPHPNPLPRRRRERGQESGCGGMTAVGASRSSRSRIIISMTMTS